LGPAACLLGLEKAGVDFVAADMRTANRLTVGIMAMVADEERRMISKRAKEALAAAKRRGVYCDAPWWKAAVYGRSIDFAILASQALGKD
jgi:DNA invertase Pin-like site-specific DNA recombinase